VLCWFELGDFTDDRERVVDKMSEIDDLKCSVHNIEYEYILDDCHRCGGEGFIEDDDYGIIEWVNCWQCKGTGENSYHS
jgi:DnaJ-class molecular chaperone